jgi:hypothetical protein
MRVRPLTKLLFNRNFERSQKTKDSIADALVLFGGEGGIRTHGDA